MDQTPKHLPQNGEPPYKLSMEARVAVLEQIAKDTKEVLGRIETRMERIDTRLDRMEDRHGSDFKWLLTLGIGATAFLFATMAHGFHWL